MADPIRLSKKLRDRGWKIKIYDRERSEPPHLTLICREKVWRIEPRTKLFMKPGGSWRDIDWRDIDPEVREILDDETHWKVLCDAWDAKHPANPVSSEEDEEDGD